MSDTFQVPVSTVPVIDTPDVCVVGGGVAGLAAAIGAARCGLKVLVIEKYGFCGGATVAGLSGTICGLYSSGNHPERIVFGFASEFHDRMEAMGGVRGRVPFGRTMLVPHDSFVWTELADCYLRGEGIDILYHTNLIPAYWANHGGETLWVRGREGLGAIQPKLVIEASGDAEVVHSIGTPT